MATKVKSSLKRTLKECCVERRNFIKIEIDPIISHPMALMLSLLTFTAFDNKQ
jgi:hypothetical protein